MLGRYMYTVAHAPRCARDEIVRSHARVNVRTCVAHRWRSISAQVRATSCWLVLLVDAGGVETLFGRCSACERACVGCAFNRLLYSSIHRQSGRGA